MFYYDHKEVWCCDLNDGEWYQNEQGRFKVDGYLDMRMAPHTHCIRTNNDVVHFITNVNARMHITVDLIDVIPKELRDKHRLRNLLLISGYGKKYLVSKKTEIIPLALIQLIGKFYSQLM